MGQDNDREHFETYREQTQVKHEILAAYLPAYFHILKKWNKNLVFIDGFAGRGTYTKADTGDAVDGSPLRALKLIAETKDFAERVSTIFIESDDQLYAELDLAVNDFYRGHPQIREPECIHGTFTECVNDLVQQVQGKLVPTFLFVDPCGVSGASFKTIHQVMNCDKCEAFIFFNIVGVNRIAGLPQLSNVLVDFMGSRARAQALSDALRAENDAAKREILILKHYCLALKQDMGIQFTSEFRIEHENKQGTSHYLIHATKHALGFAIMKDVMWRRGYSDDQEGGLAFDQASRRNITPLFDIRGSAMKEEILQALARAPLKVSIFYEDWVYRPDDRFCATAYKKALLELEADREIEILGKDGASLTPASLRPRLKGKATLAKDYHVRLAKKTKD